MRAFKTFSGRRSCIIAEVGSTRRNRKHDRQHLTKDPISNDQRNRLSRCCFNKLPVRQCYIAAEITWTLAAGTLCGLRFGDPGVLYELFVRLNVLLVIQPTLPYPKPSFLAQLQHRLIDSPFAMVVLCATAAWILWYGARSVRRNSPFSFFAKNDQPGRRLMRLLVTLSFYVCAALALLYATHLLAGMITIMKASDKAFGGPLFALNHPHELYFWAPLGFSTGFSILAVLLWDVNRRQASRQVFYPRPRVVGVKCRSTIPYIWSATFAAINRYPL